MTWCDALLSRVWCFVFCKIVARRDAMRCDAMRCDAMRCSLDFDTLFYCKIVARWVYKNTRMRWSATHPLQNGGELPTAALIPFFRQSPFRTFRHGSQPHIQVDLFDEIVEMSAWLGQRYHYFDEISWLYETTPQSLGPRYVVWNVAELSRTITTKRLGQHSSLHGWCHFVVACPPVIFIHRKTRRQSVMPLGSRARNLLGSSATNSDMHQPSATSPHFGQNCLFTNFPNINHNSWFRI